MRRSLVVAVLAVLMVMVTAPGDGAAIAGEVDGRRRS